MGRGDPRRLLQMIRSYRDGLRFLFLNPVMIRLANRLLGFRNPIA